MSESEMARMTRASQALLKALDTLRNASLAEIDAYLAHVQEASRVTRAEAEAFADSLMMDDDAYGHYGRLMLDVDVKTLLDFIYGKLE